VIKALFSTAFASVLSKISGISPPNGSRWPPSRTRRSRSIPHRNGDWRRKRRAAFWKTRAAFPSIRPPSGALCRPPAASLVDPPACSSTGAGVPRRRPTTAARSRSSSRSSAGLPARSSAARRSSSPLPSPRDHLDLRASAWILKKDLDVNRNFYLGPGARL
jgi:hypothetical protein